MKKLIVLSFITISLVFSLGRQPSKKTAVPENNIFSSRSYAVSLAEKYYINEKELKDFLSFCSNRHFPISKVYLDEPDLQNKKEQLAVLLNQLQKAGLKVYYKINTADLNNKSIFNEKVEEIITYNILNEIKFTGIVYSFGLDPLYFRDISREKIENEIEILKNTKFLIAKNKANLEIGLALPYSFSKRGLQDINYIEQIFNFLNFADIYVYSSDYTEALARAEHLLSYTEELNTPVNILIPLNPAQDRDLSYYGDDAKIFRQSLDSLENNLRSYKNFNTLVFTDYAELRNINNTLPSQNIVNALKVPRLNDLSLKLITRNQTLAVISVKHDRENIFLNFLFNDTPTGSVEINISRIQGSTAKHRNLNFRVFPDQNNTAQLKPLMPSANYAADWVLTSETRQNSYRLNLKIPKKDLFFDNLMNNYFGLNINLTTPLAYNSDKYILKL